MLVSTVFVSSIFLPNFWWCRRRCLCNVTRESTVHVGDDCVVTDLVCDAPLHVTRFFLYQDPHVFLPQDLRVWQFGIQFVLNRVRPHHLRQRERVFQRRSFRERRWFLPLSRTLFTNSSRCTVMMLSVPPILELILCSI